MTTLPRELSPTVAAVFAAVDAERQRLGVPGAVVAVRSPDAEPWSVALGVRDIATDEPLAVDAVLRVGSVTKTIVATVVLRLTERASSASTTTSWPTCRTCACRVGSRYVACST